MRGFILKAAVISVLGVSLVSAQTDKPNVKYAGIRSSYYGFKDENGRQNFPTPDEAAIVMQNIAAKFDATPSAVWIVGGIRQAKRDSKGKIIKDASCHLEFEAPESGTEYKNITFAKEDKHTEYLNKFDEIGAKVYLQVEPGMASAEELIRVVLDKYGHHKSVIGFGIDVEWYPSNGHNNFTGDIGTNHSGNETDKPIDTKNLAKLEKIVKSYNPDYKLFIKHFDPKYLGGKPVGDVVYINDSFGFPEGIEQFADEFADFANTFSPNDVAHQIGYTGWMKEYDRKEDITWWSKIEDPMVEMSNAVYRKMKNKNQVANVYWVDFTIRWKQFEDLWNK